MAGTIPFRLGEDYTPRINTLAKRLGVKRPTLIRNLLSLDPVLIDEIEGKAKTLQQVSIEDIKRNDEKDKKVPEVITFQLDEEQERRFNALAVSLGVGTKVQVLRKLLSGDPATVATVCKKAKTIPAEQPNEMSAVDTSKSKAHTEDIGSTDAIEELIRTTLSEFEEKLRAILVAQRVLPDSKVLIPKQATAPATERSNAPDSLLGHSDNQASVNPKRGRRKKVSSDVDHSKARRQIIEYFNLKSSRNPGYDTIESIKAIDKMLDAGKSVSEFMVIIDNMCHWWKDVNPDGYTHPFPETIFRPTRWNRNLANVSTPSKGEGSEKKPSSDKYEKFYL